ncbi:hypothetical protein BH24CHL6_BH24CHL6_06030 [soil metagenome]
MSREDLRGAPLLAGLLVFFPLLALYVRTLLPDVGFWDTAEFQTVGTVLGIAHPTGYPTYTLLAWLASVVLQSFGEVALRANLLSALLAAGGAGLAAASVALLTRRAVVGIAAGMALGLSEAAWSIGLRADAHALHLALVALVLLLLVGWFQAQRTGRSGDRLLLASAVVFGLSLGNHGLTVLLAPGIALFLLASRPRLPQERPRLVLGCALALGLTTVLLYAYLPLRSAMNPPLDYANPQTWEGFRYLVFAEQFGGSFRGFPQLAEAILTVGRATFHELGAFSLLAIAGAGVALLRRPQLLLMLSAWIAVNWAFALGYDNADIERYRLVPLMSVAVLGGLGAAALVDGGLGAWRRWRPPRWSTPGGRSASALRALGSLALAALLLAPTLANVPDRFRQVDQSTWHFARQWLEAVLPQLERDALVVSWWSYSTPLWYAQHVEGRRTDIFVADDRVIIDQGLGSALQVIDDNLGRRPVYLIRLARDLPAFEQRFRLSRLLVPGGADGWVYRVEGRQGEG